MGSLLIKFDYPYSTHLENMIYVIHGRDGLLYIVLLVRFICSIPCVSGRIPTTKKKKKKKKKKNPPNCKQSRNAEKLHGK
jgi:hypothetical protein